MVVILRTTDVVMTTFFDRDLNTTKHIWQALLHVRGAALNHDGSNNFWLSTPGTRVTWIPMDVQ